MRASIASIASIALLGALAACNPATQPTLTPKQVEGLPMDQGMLPKPEDAAGDPFVVEGTLREEQLPLLKGPQPTTADAALDAPIKGLPKAPPTCDAFVKRQSKPTRDCADRAASLAVLDDAFAQADAQKRDELLAAAEGCTGIEPGLVRSLRIELAPAECGDVLAEPVLKAKPVGMSGAVQHALIGQAVAARLARTVGAPPVFKGAFTSQRVLEFTKKSLWPWYEEQSQAVKALSAKGRELSAYGKGLVALQSGWANLRLVEVVREAPVPDDYKKDPEMGNAYYGTLDEKLEPTKSDGRDGALVGLGTMVQAGVISDERMKTTRALLAKMYGGRRVDSLDVLGLTPLALPAESNALERLASKLPSFHAGLLLPPESAKEVGVLRSLLHRGVPMPMRAALKEADAGLSDEVRALYGRARLEMAIRYWRVVDVDAAVGQFAKMDRAKMKESDRLLFALAIALRNGPEDVAMLMLKNQAFGLQFGDVRALDAVTKSATDKGIAGLSAFDAGVLRQIGAPRDADAAYWQGLEQRYKDAAAMLTDSKLRFEADERAKAASAQTKILNSQ